MKIRGDGGGFLLYRSPSLPLSITVFHIAIAPRASSSSIVPFLMCSRATTSRYKFRLLLTLDLHFFALKSHKKIERGTIAHF
jgi:hypothetical protein